MLKPCIMIGPIVGQKELEEYFYDYSIIRLKKYPNIKDIFVCSDNYDKYVLPDYDFHRLNKPEACNYLSPKGFFYEDQRLYQYYAMVTSYELTLLDMNFYVVDHIYPVIYEDDYFNLKQFEVK